MATLNTLFLVCALSLIVGLNAQDCEKRYFNWESFVCVCNSTFCDYSDPVTLPPTGSFLRVISSRDAHRYAMFTGQIEPSPSGEVSVSVNHNFDYQKMLGFGGAFTDSTGLNVVTLSQAAQDQFVRSYFAPEGLRYSVCRIPVAGSDFSTHAYSYDDVDGDVDLLSFSLTYEDFNYKIPFIQKALELNPDLLLFGSPWAPPAWMKENGMANGTGGLLKEMWQPWANYLVKFIQEYESNNVPIWGLTPQNEPLTGFSDWMWNTCAWSPEDMRDWIKGNMGPTFKLSNLDRVKIMVLDHNRDALPWYAAIIYEDTEATQYVHGTAVHWYDDANTGPEVLNDLVARFPDKFVLYTESCEGWYGASDDRVHLGEWQRAENYAVNILEDINHYSRGWVDWNMALDMQGGPNWANNFVDAPIIINAANDEFYKQPTFYAMGHFSKYISRNATRLNTNVLNGATSIKASAFHNDDGSEVIVLINTSDTPVSVSVEDHVGAYVNIQMDAKSMETILIREAELNSNHN